MSLPPRPPLCVFCSRFDRESENPPACTSFPRGIPDDIYDAISSHTVSRDGEPTFDGSIPMGWELADPRGELSGEGDV